MFFGFPHALDTGENEESTHELRPPSPIEQRRPGGRENPRALYHAHVWPGLLLTSGMGWLLVLGGFVVLGALFRNLAHSAASVTTQYVGLCAYVVLEAIIFVPLLAMADAYAPGAIQSAGLVTMLGFAGLTAVAFTTRKDFSFLGGMIRWGFILALIAIVAAAIFGFNLGTFFSVAMVGLAGASVLYDTSNVLHHFSENSHVAAALELFASIALMFWYVLRLFMGSRNN
jgi:uncharacterized protein